MLTTKVRRRTSVVWQTDPANVRYIKLGEGGGWEHECMERNIVRLGFGSARAERFDMCLRGDWKALRKSFVTEGKSASTATRFTNEMRLFFEDDGTTLWITFVGERLCWGFLDPAVPAKRHKDGDGVFRPVVGSWRSCDAAGVELTKDKLSGALTQLAAYRGTSCTVRARSRTGIDVADYVIRRIKGETRPSVERALAATREMRKAAIGLMKDLDPKDFEILIDLIFSSSGWRRLGPVGRTQATLDLNLVLPTTGERAFVQVKSKTTSAQLAEYVAKIDDQGEDVRMFYIYHSGEAHTDDERVMLIDAEKLAGLVVNSGLVDWLIQKVS